MRNLSPTEILSLREALELEVTNLVKVKPTKDIIEDDQLRGICETAIFTAQQRIAGLQQFIKENQVVEEVH